VGGVDPWFLGGFLRLLLRTFLFTWLGLGALALFSQLVSNSRFLARSNAALRDWADSKKELTQADKVALVEEVTRRAVLYDDKIQKTSLLDGMLVNRSLNGDADDECDSLLFSSLRYVGLHKLGLERRAANAWKSIAASRDQNQWIRHPRCRRSPSRDMLLGVLIALSQRPDGFFQHTNLLLERVAKHDGHFADGPVYLTYVTPGVAKLMRLVALSNSVTERDLPDVVRDGHSTSELTFYGLRPGYQAHLIALSVWLEMELNDVVLSHDEKFSFTDIFQHMVAPFSGRNIVTQATDWDTAKLVELDPENMFFRYLRLKAAGALTDAVRYQLLGELLAMSQFPPDRLPLDCDRRADYVWQRAWRETKTTAQVCSKQFNGADFLWMAGLIIDNGHDDEASNKNNKKTLSH
jgi:hypothetical protein